MIVTLIIFMAYHLSLLAIYQLMARSWPVMGAPQFKPWNMICCVMV